ncbi:hypothetical protein KJ909_01100 [Patescibacteria group bacterium]|nr:hypothetical protein [Patescibacteria group bacterium]
MHFTCRSFIGKPEPGHWSQYWENEPDDPFIVGRRGHLFGLLSLKFDDDSQSASDFGHQIIREISQSYFSSSELGPADQLHEAINSVTANLDPQVSFLSIITAVVYQQTLYLFIYGQGHVILRRLNQIAPLLTGKDNQSVSLSGPLRAEDDVFFCTSAYFDQTSWKKIKEILSFPSIKEIEESALSSLYSLPDQIAVSAALVQPHFDTPPEEPEAPPPIATPPPVEDSSPPRPSFSLPSFFKKALSKKPELYVSHHQVGQLNKRKKLNIAIALVLLLALAFSSYFGFRKTEAAKAEAKFSQLSQKITDSLKNARDVKNINLESSVEFAAQADSLYQEIALLNLHQEQLDSFHQQIQDILAQTGSSQGLSLDFFYDTSSISSKPKYSQMIFSDDSLYLLDSSIGRVDSLGLENKNTKNISISDDIKNALTLVKSDNNYYILTATDVSLLAKTKTEAKIKFSDIGSNIKPLDLQSWNSALYLLTDSSIYKYTLSGSSFSSPSAWLQDETVLPQNPSSFAINGKIWLLSATGKLQPYIRGLADNYQLSQTQDISQAKNLLTGLDDQRLFFTASDNLVYVYDKDGQFISKYNLGDQKIQDIAFDEKASVLYLLCQDQKIYYLSL